MSITSAIRKMVSSGFTLEQALRAAEIFETETAEYIVDPATERRRAWDRERKREKRARPVESGGNPVDSSHVNCPVENGQFPVDSPVDTVALARVEDNLLTIDITGKKERRIASRLSDAFKPTLTMRLYAKEKGLSDGQIDTEGEAMRDWSLSSPKGLKLDWEAAWRNWVTRKIETKGNGNGSGHEQGRRGSLVDAGERLQKRLAELRRSRELRPGDGDGPREDIIRMLPGVGRE